MAKQLTLTLPDEVHDDLLRLAYDERVDVDELVAEMLTLHRFVQDKCKGRLMVNDNGKMARWPPLRRPGG